MSIFFILSFIKFSTLSGLYAVNHRSTLFGETGSGVATLGGWEIQIWKSPLAPTWGGTLNEFTKFVFTLKYLMSWCQKPGAPKEVLPKILSYVIAKGIQINRLQRMVIFRIKNKRISQANLSCFLFCFFRSNNLCVEKWCPGFNVFKLMFTFENFFFQC